MIFEQPPLEGGKLICPICMEEKAFCKEHKMRGIGEKSVAKIYLDLRKEAGKEGLGLLKEAIFGYDMRFLVPGAKKFLVEELPYYFKAAEINSRTKAVVFSHDMRVGNEIVREAFLKYCKEMSDAECFFVGGFISTTASPFLAALLSYQLGKKVLALHATASHNPPEYNGIKGFYGKMEKDIFPEKIELKEKISSEEVSKACAAFELQNKGKVFEEDFYFDFLHGVGFSLLKFILPEVGKKYRIMNEKPLQDFGGLIPEPSEKHEGKFGFVSDGDADRIALYYDGKVVNFSQFLAIAAELGLFKGKIVLDQRVSPVIVDFLKEKGVEAIVGDVGRTNQEKIAIENDAMWCEENWHSGGYLVKGERIYWPEAVLGFLKALEYIGEVGTNKFFSVSIPEPLFAKEKVRAFPGANEKFFEAARKLYPDLTVMGIPSGGVRVETESGHFVIRESKTEIGVGKIYATGMSEKELKENISRARKVVELSFKI